MDCRVTMRRRRSTGFVVSWCAATTGPRRIERAPLVESANASSSSFAGLGLDVRNAFRLIRRQPGFALASIVMIALGIAATTTLFSVVYGVLLKPLPWKQADRIVRLQETREGAPGIEAAPVFLNVTYWEWARNPQTIEGLGAWQPGPLRLDGDGGVEDVQAARVTASLFPLLGVSPLVGTGFTEGQELSTDSVILSYGFWQERYGAAPDVVGKRITLGGTPRTIIGVMPRQFWFPTRAARLWIPMRVETAYRPAPGGLDWAIRIVNAVARLKPGATPAQAASEASARANAAPREITRTLTALAGSTGPVKVTATPWLDRLVNDVKPALWMLLAAVGLLFIAAIGNVVNMQLAQAAARRREIAIRSAIGAGSGRLARQLFVETATIAVLGGALGLALTRTMLRLLPALLPSNFPRTQDIGLDAAVLAFVAALTMAASVVAGFLPARLARRVNLAGVLADDGSAPVGQGFRSPVARSRALVITGQVAIAALLLVGAALLSQSFVKLFRTDRGYTPANLMTARVTLQGQRERPAVRTAFYRDLLDRVAAIGGVTDVGLTNTLPLTPTHRAVHFNLGLERSPVIRGQAARRAVSVGYFDSMGIRVMQGRGFTAQDVPASEKVVVVNQTFARQFLAGDPLGAIINGFFDDPEGSSTIGPDGPPWRVAGVVADVQHRAATEPLQPEIYVAVGQMTHGPDSTQFLTTRAGADPERLAADLRAVVRGTNANAVIDQVMTMETRLLNSLERPRLNAVLLGGFATFALLIAGVGLFGGLSYAVSQRTREIGVRTALGATPRDIIALVVKQGAVMTVVGLSIGLGGAAASVRFLARFLFGVTPFDPATFAVVGVALLFVALIACAIPARRAARIDAITALRH
jgi:putative ABC transport system permease protein